MNGTTASNARPAGSEKQTSTPADRVHVALAAIYAFTLPLQTGPKEVTFGLLVVCAIARLGQTRLRYRGLWDRVGLLLAAWAVWTALSIAWSTDPKHGLDELKVFRFLLTGFALWPILPHATWIVGGFLAGVLAQNGVQLCQGLHWFGFKPGPNDRLDGLASPIVVGLLCGMVMCWHLAAALSTHGWLRAVSILAFAAAILGLVFSGSRGPWIAAAVAMAAQIGFIIVRRRELRKPVIAVALISVAVAAFAFPVARPLVSKRVEQTIADLEAMRSGGYGTDVGFRLLSWQTGLEMFREHPIIGSGAGAFYEEAPLVRDGQRSIGAGHAHSVYVHVLACTGIVGLGLLLAIFVATLVRSFRGEGLGTPWDDGLPFVCVMWGVAAAFDSFHVSGQTFAILILLITLTSPSSSSGRAPRASTGQEPAPDAPSKT